MYNMPCICGCSSSGRAPPCQGGGSEFEPRHPLHFALVAQLDRVTGYEPVGQGFESLPARHKKQYNFGYAVFYFVRNLQGLEPPLGEAEHNRDSRSERWAEPSNASGRPRLINAR